MHKKINITSRKAILFSIFTILFLISLSIFFYLNKNKDIPKNPTAYPTPNSTPSFSISNLSNGWQLYKSNDLGFEISYPEDKSIKFYNYDGYFNLEKYTPTGPNCGGGLCFMFSISIYKDTLKSIESSAAFKNAKFVRTNAKIGNKDTFIYTKSINNGDNFNGISYKIPVNQGSYLISVDYTEFHTKQSDELAQKILQSFRIIE